MNSKAPKSFLYANNSKLDLRSFHAEIASSLRTSGTLPEELADLLTVTVVHNVNEDGSPRYVIDVR